MRFCTTVCCYVRLKCTFIEILWPTKRCLVNDILCKLPPDDNKRAGARITVIPYHI